MKSLTWFQWLAVILLCVVIVVPIAVGFYWLLWQLYLFVIQGLWPDGPYAVTHPSFWVFAGAFFLLKCVFRGVFSSSPKAGR